MTPKEKVLKDFETRVRQMLLRFQQLKKENEELYSIVEKNERDVQQLQDKLEQKGRDYDSLKMAKMIEITNGDLEEAKNRLSKLIKDVNKCIAILGEAK